MTTIQRESAPAPTLATYADAVMGDRNPKVRPSEAGPACRAFTRMFAEIAASAYGVENTVVYGEHQIASALVYLEFMRFFPREWFYRVGGHTRFPIIVLHGDWRLHPRYAVFLQTDHERQWQEPVDGMNLFYKEIGAAELRERIQQLEWPPFLDPFFASIPIEIFGNAVLELADSWREIPTILIPPLQEQLTSGIAVPGCSVVSGSNTSCIGVVGTIHGIAVATTVAHAVGQSSTVQVNGTQCRVIARDFVQDVAAIDITMRPLANRSVKGPLRGLTPNGGQQHAFIGARGQTSDAVIGWDATIPWMATSPSVQSHVYTGCITVPGDSGAALVSPSDHVIGFAQLAMPQASHSGPYQSAIPGVSAWVWAESSYAALNII